ncbi:microprocessor complex subunit DGCR8 [Condylostylus longicornis]|uniref:microprocessor complex subunit DGCR8 n=1 Tax=Condylostylus longicornis TaxID=2530218 RepID=UPI00244E527C|nr:microprocessor complex subunit DGCR8 [Condylostylus longicornis]
MDYEHPEKRIRLEDSKNETVSQHSEGINLQTESNYSKFERVLKRTKVEEPGIELNDSIKEFQLLDEVQGSNSEEDDDALNSNNEYSSSLDIDESEIENLLDEALPDEIKNKKKQCQYEEKFKTVLDVKGHNHFEVLPEGWVEVTHNSGMPIYLHKQTRVCSVSKPYFLGPGSARKHEVPLTSIPCLSYRKALEKEAEINKDKLQMNGNEKNNQDMGEISAQPNDGEQNIAVPKTFVQKIPNACIETAKENIESQSLSPESITEYCKRLFKFKTIRVMRFRSWSARRKFTKNRKNIKIFQRPTLPDGTKLIKFPILSGDQNQPNTSLGRCRKEWIMNPNGKSYVCILHEYVQHALKKQPTYEFKELENSATPYCATVAINSLKYGTGYGTSKKQAKSEAARETLEILIPEMKDKITGEKQTTSTNKCNLYKDLSIFDDIKIEDPRVAEFCNKTTEPSPHAILLTCLQRNFGFGDVQINYEINTTKHKKNEFTMTVGKHSATVNCKNKKEGKQLASQAILQMLHPHLKTWGSLLRLYGNNSVKSFKEKKQEEQEITALQSKAAINQPNYAILNKLKKEMTKLAESQKAMKSLGTFTPPCDVTILAKTNLNNIEL